MLTFKCFFVLYFLSWLFVKFSFLRDRFASCCSQSSVNALVTLYVQFLCSDWWKFDMWVYAKNLCSILKLVKYCDSLSWQSFVSTCDVFNHCWLSFSTGCTKWNLATIKSLLLFMASLSIGFLVEKYVACQSRKSDFDGIDSFSFFTLLDWKVWSDVASRSCLSNYCICVCFFHISNFMKPSAVYEAITYACLNWDLR